VVGTAEAASTPPLLHVNPYTHFVGDPVRVCPQSSIRRNTRVGEEEGVEGKESAPKKRSRKNGRHSAHQGIRRQSLSRNRSAS